MLISYLFRIGAKLHIIPVTRVNQDLTMLILTQFALDRTGLGLVDHFFSILNAFQDIGYWIIGLSHNLGADLGEFPKSST